MYSKNNSDMQNYLKRWIGVQMTFLFFQLRWMRRRSVYLILVRTRYYVLVILENSRRT